MENRNTEDKQEEKSFMLSVTQIEQKIFVATLPLKDRLVNKRALKKPSDDFL
jgi:hypothetical protein